MTENKVYRKVDTKKHSYEKPIILVDSDIPFTPSIIQPKDHFVELLLAKNENKEKQKFDKMKAKMVDVFPDYWNANKTPPGFVLAEKQRLQVVKEAKRKQAREEYE